jgi:hypothetical protein
MLRRFQGSWNTHDVLVEMHLGTVAFENSFLIVYETKAILTIGASKLSLGNYLNYLNEMKA